MGDSSSFHLESFQGPVTGRNGSNEAGGYGVSVKMDMRIRVELVGAIRFLQDLVDGRLEVGIEFFEKIFKEKRE